MGFDAKKQFPTDSWIWLSLEKVFPIRVFCSQLKTNINRLVQDQVNMAGRVEQSNQIPKFFPVFLAVHDLGEEFYPD